MTERSVNFSRFGSRRLREDLSPDCPAWRKQPGESKQAFKAFEIWRSEGSIRKAARRLGVCRQLLERWSVKWRWMERQGALIDHEDRLRREARERLMRYEVRHNLFRSSDPEEPRHRQMRADLEDVEVHLPELPDLSCEIKALIERLGLRTW